MKKYIKKFCTILMMVCTLSILSNKKEIVREIIRLKVSGDNTIRINELENQLRQIIRRELIELEIEETELVHLIDERINELLAAQNINIGAPAADNGQEDKEDERRSKSGGSERSGGSTESKLSTVSTGGDLRTPLASIIGTPGSKGSATGSISKFAGVAAAAAFGQDNSYPSTLAGSYLESIGSAPLAPTIRGNNTSVMSSNTAHSLLRAMDNIDDIATDESMNGRNNAIADVSSVITIVGNNRDISAAALHTDEEEYEENEEQEEYEENE